MRHFSAGGLYDGLLLLVDDETKTLWNHITGEAMFGPRVDQKLEPLPVEVMRFDTARTRFPGLTVSEGSPGFGGWVLSALVGGDGYNWSGHLTSRFRETMGSADQRLPEQTSGLGVVVDGAARFYPKASIGAGIMDVLGGRTLRVDFAPGEFARARFNSATESVPQQLLTRWYGFSATYPGCSIYGKTR